MAMKSHALHSIMLTFFPFLAPFCVLILLGTADALTIGTKVHLRIEGANSTIFEGPIFTRGHNVTTLSGEVHVCDGTNRDANLIPSATCTSALDDASKLAGFSWDGTYKEPYEDFVITRIGSSHSETQSWGILLNYAFIPSTGCQQQVEPGDNILFAYDAFDVEHFLMLEPVGPRSVSVNEPVALVVTDGTSGDTISGASVTQLDSGLESISDAQGYVSFTFTTPGQYVLKGARNDSIRSNAVTITVVA